LRGGKHYRSVVFNNPFVLFPEWFKGNNGVPLAGGGSSAVGEVAEHHINAFVCKKFHNFKAITLNDAIQLHLPYGMFVIYHNK
jgi:hypothetical protein